MIGGLGSALADVAGGYAYYFIPTLLIKGLEGCMVAYLFQKYGNKIKWIAYFLGCMIMVIGYFFAKWYLKGSMIIALSGIAENILQSGVGYVIAIVALPLIQRQFYRCLLYTSFFSSMPIKSGSMLSSSNVWAITSTGSKIIAFASIFESLSKVAISHSIRCS